MHERFLEMHGLTKIERDVNGLTILFIIEDGLKTTFYLYVLREGKKRLIRFSPDLLLADGESMAQKFITLSMEELLVLFEKLANLTIKNYVVGSKKEIVGFLLREEQSITINNSQAFVYEAEEITFKQGKMVADRRTLEAFISYQVDEGNAQGIYERQEHVLRLLKNDLLRDKRITAMPKRFNQLKKLIRTNIGVSDLLKFFKAYKERGQEKTQRLTVSAGEAAQDSWVKEINQFLSE
ncbi:hypothetical protein A5888_003443 [Enterococcus sp. 9E7_DIV0242]|uniref:Cell envelope-related transcriptional attenuator domain-containing protein n=1 Tax=Candidatus Enterococcus clewellii TaxID=1834193 RepID=A0A242K1V6_9ENTE|nr:hypothetical protein A5888_003737 [Enterococcus sp. 9E7_DIV0242]